MAVIDRIFTKFVFSQKPFYKLQHHISLKSDKMFSRLQNVTGRRTWSYILKERPVIETYRYVRILQ